MTTESGMDSLFGEFLFQTDCVAGVDEAGRGCLAGPVTAAAVILDPAHPIDGLADSKTLSATKRQALAVEIKAHALAYAIGWASREEIDLMNILQATFLAMRRAIEALSITPQLVLIDGNRAPKLTLPYETVVKGDAKIQAISAASILAKTARDAYMADLAKKYPPYGFDVHAGYGTQAHLKALQTYGVTPEHRQTFRPICENAWGPYTGEPRIHTEDCLL